MIPGATDSVKLDVREVPIQELPKDVTIVEGFLCLRVPPTTQFSPILLPGVTHYVDPPRF
jgi:hypothetical protein